ncbi:hypothetical protein EP7_001119 [Isosphaeraceae bacterium EP7]
MNWRLRVTSMVLPALAGLIALFAPEGRANAMGCHAPDRPIFGLSSGWERVDSNGVGEGIVAVGSHQVRPTPCDRGVPGEPSRRIPTTPVITLNEGWIEVEAGPASLDSRRPVESDRVGAPPAASTPDRPPR